MIVIKNIIFDLGGVILELDCQRLLNAFAKFSTIPLATLFNQRHQLPLFDLFETGKMSEKEFRQALLAQLEIKSISDHEFDTAWNSMLGAIPVARLNCIKALRKNYKTILLSNTNTIHIKCIETILERTIGQRLFTEFFDNVYYSCQVGMRKPEHTILNYILTENAMKPEETLFVDDTLANIESAQQCKMPVMHITETRDLLNISDFLN